MGRQKGFHWTDEEKKKIGDAQRAYRDRIGRVVDIDQRESPEAYREYQREYQRKYREKHPDYYKKYHTKPLPKDMIKLQEIVTKFNEFQCSSLEAEYKTSAFNEEKMKTIVEDLNKLMNDYVDELKNEAEDVSKPQH